MSPPPASLRIHSRPAWAAPNPYTAMLADALVAAGAEVHEADRRPGRMPRDGAVLLYHWPDEFFTSRGARRMARALLTLAEIGWARARHGARLVWVVHNVVPHDRASRRFAVGQRLFFAMLDGVVFLSRASERAFDASYPRLQRVPRVVTTHGSYLPRAITPATPPRPIDGRPASLGFVGQVRSYKAPDRLARLVAGRDDARVAITGNCPEPDLRARLIALAANAPDRVTLDLRYQTDAEIEAATDAADAIVLPYADILNSGSALLALSRARPVIAPALGSLIELRDQVGRDWVWLYAGAFDADTLAAGVEWLRSVSRPALPDLSAHDWRGIGTTVAAFLRGLPVRN